MRKVRVLPEPYAFIFDAGIPFFPAMIYYYERLRKLSATKRARSLSGLFAVDFRTLRSLRLLYHTGCALSMIFLHSHSFPQYLHSHLIFFEK